jgi:hypothetical protein
VSGPWDAGVERDPSEAAIRLDTQLARLHEALKLRNDFFNSAYYVERIIAQRRLILVSIGMALLLAMRWRS